MKQPDRFARRAKKELATPWVLNQPRLAMLFRAEHRAVVRLVKQQERYGMGSYIMMPKAVGAWINVEDLLAALARRAR